MKKNITLPLPLVLAQFILMLLITVFVVVPKLVSAQSVTDLLVHFDHSGGDSWINTGNVGIGTVNPQTKLAIANETDDSTFDGRRDLLQLSNTSNNAITVGLFGVQHPNLPSTVQFGAWNAGQNLSFVTDLKSNVESGLSTRGIFIKSGGNVGIGTNAPNNKLDIKSDGISTTPFSITDDDSAAKLVEIGVGSSANPNLYMHTDAGDTKVQIATAGKTYFNGGNVGIGTTAVTHTLTVKGSVCLGNC